MHLVLMVLLIPCSSAKTLPSPFSNLTDHQIQTALTPWDWNIHPINTTTSSCPDASHTLGMFAAINVIGVVVSLISGHRDFVHIITCKILGRSNSQFWFLSVILQIGWHIGASFLNAFLVSKVPGYSPVPVSQLAWLFLARPRLTLIRTGVYRNTAMASTVTEIILQFFWRIYNGSYCALCICERILSFRPS